jgi:TatD DNase family protein
MLAPPPALAAPVIDTHCHVDMQERGRDGLEPKDPDELIALAASVGVTKLVQIGCDVASARWSVEMAQTRPDVIVGVALHPNEAPRLFESGGQAELDAAYRVIEELATDPVVRAVGETGLDYFRTEGALREVQQASFRWHIDLARTLDKTLVIHDRDAHDDVMGVLTDQGAPNTVVFHCFSGDAAMAQACAEQGWYMSFAGVVTFKNNDALREALAIVPDHLVLVETDSPYLTPVPHRGKPNGSYLMPLTVRCIAEVRGIDEAAAAALLWDNAQRAFGEW